MEEYFVVLLWNSRGSMSVVAIGNENSELDLKT
jgi:hypothetical protein